jgi:hypothetical protein
MKLLISAQKAHLRASTTTIIQTFLLVLPVFILAAICLLRIDGPAYRSDEIAYLSSAASIAGKHNALATAWYKGYSLLLAPFFQLVPDVLDAWPAVILVNSLALAATSICLWLALQRTAVADRNLAFRLVLLGQLVFGTTAYVGWAFTNCVQMASVSAACLLLSSPSFGRIQAIGLGLILGFGTWIHPTGVLVAGAACLISAIVARPNKPSRWWLGALVLMIALAMAIPYLRVVHPWVDALQGGIKVNHYREVPGKVLEILKDPGSATMRLLVLIANTLASTAVASFGYAGALMAVVIHPWRTPRLSLPAGAGLKRVLLFLLVSWGFLIMFSLILPFVNPTKIYLAFHQRYIQPVVPALVVFGMALAPKRWHDRIWVWLYSAVPILLALAASLLVYRYESYFNTIDLLGNVTFFLDPSLNHPNVQLMLASGLIVTGMVQIFGWSAFLPLATSLAMLGWVRTDNMHRKILQTGSRPPAMAKAATTLGRSGIKSCVYLARTPATPDEHEIVMRYYLSGRNSSIFSSHDPFPQDCDILIRPVDSEVSSAYRIPPKNRPDCKPVIVDTFAKQILEDCRKGVSSSDRSIERLLLPARRDLVSLGQIRQERRPNERVAYISHWDGLITLGRSGSMGRSWWRAEQQTSRTLKAKAGTLLLEEPGIMLPAGAYRAVFIGLSKSSGPFRVSILSDDKMKVKQTWLQVNVDRSQDSFSFSLPKPEQLVTVKLTAAENGAVIMPEFLIIFASHPIKLSPWAGLSSLL